MSRPRLSTLGIMAALTLLSATPAFATTNTGTEAAGKLNMHLVTVQQAQKNNVKGCLSLVNDISDFLFKDAEHSAHGQFNNKLNDSFYTAMVEEVFSDGSVLHNISMVPSSSGECRAEYTTMLVLNKNCTHAMGDIESAKFVDSLSTNVSLFKQDGVDVYALPVGKNKEYCQVIRKETISRKI